MKTSIFQIETVFIRLFKELLLIPKSVKKKMVVKIYLLKGLANLKKKYNMLKTSKIMNEF